MTNLEVIRECLGQFPASSCDYEEWLKVGMAIKHEGGDCALWDEWSAADSRHRKSDCTRRWQNLDRGRDPVTVATVVRLCREKGGTPPKGGGPAGDGREWEEIPMEGAVRCEPRWEELSAVPPEQKIVRREWLEMEELPPDDGAGGAEQLSRYLRALFEEEDHVGYVASAILTEPNAAGERHWVPAGKGVYSYTARELLASLASCRGDLGAVVGDWEEDCGAWIRFNPLDGNGVNDANVTDFRYALVESDTIPVQEQWSIIRKLELPVAAIVHSGAKSLHAIVKIHAPDYREYQRRVDRLYEICKANGLVIDRKNRNPSRLSRMPGVTRKGVPQRLLAVDVGKGSWQEWLDWMAAQNDELPEFEDFSSLYGCLPPLADCLIEGILRQGHKMLVSGPAKAGKSFLLLELAVAIAEGGTWLGWRCRQGRVLYVNLELDRASCLHRIRDIYEAMGIRSPRPHGIEVWNLRGMAVPMDKLAPMLIRRALKDSLAAVILDPIYKVITGDENSADQMAHFCNQFDRVCHELGCAFVYCHHHSKGSQGQKVAQDRASGSGVFSRDPDALVDIVELDISEERRAQIQCRRSVRALQSLLDRKSPDWREEMEMEDAERLHLLIDRARRLCGDEADRVNGDAIRATHAMTGWRISGILREFPTFPDKYAFFNYPLHEEGPEVSDLLRDCRAMGEFPPPMSREGRREAGRQAATRRHEEASSETRMVCDSLSMSGDGVITTAGVADALGIDSRSALRRLKQAGYVQASKGVWTRKGDALGGEAK